MSAPFMSGGGIGQMQQKQRGPQQTDVTKLGLNDAGTGVEAGPEWSGSRLSEAAAGQPIGMGLHSMAPNMPDMQLAASVNGSNPLWSASPQAQGASGGLSQPDQKEELAKVQNRTARTVGMPRAQIFGPAGVPSQANR